MIRLCLVIMLCVTYSSITAQYNKKSPNRLYQVPANSWTLRWNTINILDPLEPNINFGVEYRIKERFSVATDVGYVFFNSALENAKTSGIILRPAARYYTEDNKRFFVEGEFLIKLVNNKVTDWLGQNCVNNVPTYEEYKSFIVRKNVYGFQAKIGRVGKLSKDNKFSMEWYLGLGLRYKSFKVIKEPNSCYNLRDFDILGAFSGESKMLLPSMPLGFRLIYLL